MAHESDDGLRQVLVERGPRSDPWIVGFGLLSLIGLVILAICGLVGIGSPLDVIGLVLFVPFGAMAINGTFWKRRRQRAS
jgi:hypothetical protein